MSEGLNSNQVKKNQKLYGLNVIKDSKTNLKKFIKQLNDPTIIAIFILVIIQLLKKKYMESIILLILFFILFTIHFTIIIKNYKLNKKKKSIFDYKVKVIRDEKETIINSTELTLNDIMILNKGDKVMADAIIIDSNDLMVWEPILESSENLISKSHNFINKNEKFKSNYVYSSSFILKGNCIAKVTNIGKNTQIAKQENNSTRIKNKRSKMISLLNVLAVILLIITIIFIKGNLLYRMIFGLFVCIIILPYPLNFFITNIYPYRVNKFINKNILYTNIKDIKKLDKISYLCLDKTNIITEGKMEIENVKSVIDNNELIKHALLASSLSPIDEIEEAILEYSKNININIENIENVKKFPFDKDNKISANIYKENNTSTIYVKGSLESIFDICNIGVQEKYKLYNFKDDMINNGYKVIAVGSKKIDEIKNDIYDYTINFEGIILIYDKLKPNINKYIRYCQDNNIKILIFTEDNKQISKYIGKTIGIDNYENVLDNNEIDTNLDNIKNTNIFSHINSKTKIKIINNIQKDGNTIMMIGNNTNDIFSLIKSDISVTYNNSSNLIKDNVSIINLDNNLGTIVNNIKEVKEFNIKTNKIYNRIHILNFLIVFILIILFFMNINIYYLINIIVFLKILLLIYIFVKYK